jgi:tetratricopeptide (TPR) repeat protein
LPTEAIEILERAIQVEPENTEARVWLGLVFLNEAFRFNDAMAVLAEAVDIDPNRADCLDLLAEALRRDGRPADAFIGLLQRAVESAPTWVLPRVHLAFALRDIGRRQEAREQLQVALANDGSVPEPTDPVEHTYEWEVTGRIGSREFIEPALKALAALDTDPSVG